MINTSVKGMIGTSAAVLTGVPKILATVPESLRDPTKVGGLIVILLTAISLYFDIRKKWRDRNK